MSQKLQELKRLYCTTVPMDLKLFTMIYTLSNLFFHSPVQLQYGPWS